jgi:hypothetical protein
VSARHTPGPWTFGVRRDGSIWLSIGDPKGRGAHYQGDLVATPEDARLIVAAPELLGELQKLLAYADGIHRLQAHIDGEGVDYVTFPEARAAIAKATGSAA